MDSLKDTVLAAFPLKELKRDPAQCAPLVLAYIGDTIYDLYVRTMLVSTGDLTTHKLHLAAAKHVCAAAQAKAFQRIEPTLCEEELALSRRGRNAHMGTIPKNATIRDYRAATGFETLIGYLYLAGRDERLQALMNAAIFEEAAHAGS
ncbi:MAG: ribonuclease III domain-containing protein [Bacillota bacterium]